MKQEGFALLVVLMFLGIMSALAVNMTTRFQTNLKRTEFQGEDLQHQWLFRLAEERALAILRQSLEDSPKLTSREQFWAQPQSLEIDERTRLTWQLNSGQDCYNLNALANVPTDSQKEEPYSVAVFRAILAQAGVEGLNADALIDAIADYIDKDNIRRRDGAEDDDYSDKPMRFVANQPLFTVSEIRSIKGMSATLYNKLLPWLCVQENTDLQINVSFLTPDKAPLVAALFLNKLSTDDARKVLLNAPKFGWSAPEQLLTATDRAYPHLKDAVNIAKGGLTSQSDYFVLISRISRDDKIFTRRSDLFYQRKSRELWVYSHQRVFNDE